ncbi:MAG: DUF721 domain-containing protein [Planctomycetota bacterium]
MSQPKHVGQDLRALLREAGSRAGHGRIRTAVDQVLGPDLAECVQVAGFRRGVLTLEVESPALLAELRGFRCEDIRVACNALNDKEQITRIVFRMRGTTHA